MVLGVDAEQKFSQSVMDLQGGDLLLLYTDGLTDAMNFQDQIWGRQRLVASFTQTTAAGASAEVAAQHLLWDMRRFAGLTRRTDDVTMLVVKMT
jgi:sigma-B regulation protein RsbU (phosphoserine phosphatase)